MSELANADAITTPRWLHRWAVLTVCATVVLLLLGSVVTTFRVGMADPIWPTYPWHLLLVDWSEPSAGFLIEHTHRAFGYLVGCCVILLAVGLWRKEPRRWLRNLGFAALGAVIVQGLLGGFRVRLNELVGTDLAVVHGCFAQIVLALLVAIAILTAPRGACLVFVDNARRRVLRGAVALAALAFVQIVFGVMVRQTASPVGQRGHLLTAFAVLGVATWLTKETLAVYRGDRRLRLTAHVLGALLAVQLVLGVEAWLMKFKHGAFADAQPITLGSAIVRTAHFFAGTLIFATAVSLVLMNVRRCRSSVEHDAVSSPRLEEAA